MPAPTPVGPARAVAGALLAAALLGGCATSVGVPAAPDAADPLCARVIVSLPDELPVELPGELDAADRRGTTSQSTAAWGDPPVVLRCGVPSPDATTDLCSTVDGVDWVLTELDGGRRYTTFGRDPGVDVTIPDDGPPPDVVLAALSPPVRVVEQARACL